MTGFWWFLLGLIGLTLGLHLAARLWYLPAAGRIFSQTPWLPSGWCAPRSDGQPVLFTTADGRRLRGTLLPAAPGQRRGAIACCHEFNADRWNTVSCADALCQHGFDVLLFDFCNHGASDRVVGYDPTPWVTSYEVADVRAAVEYLAGRADAPHGGIGLFGVGRGATAALCAAEHPCVKALVLDSLSPNDLPRWARVVIGWRRRCTFVNVQQAARCVRQPLLMIHGQCDPHVPAERVEGLCGALLAPARLWIVPGAKHNGAVRVAPEAYCRRVAEFFMEHLTSRELPETAPPPPETTPEPDAACSAASSVVRDGR